MAMTAARGTTPHCEFFTKNSQQLTLYVAALGGQNGGTFRVKRAHYKGESHGY